MADALRDSQCTARDQAVGVHGVLLGQPHGLGRHHLQQLRERDGGPLQALPLHQPPAARPQVVARDLQAVGAVRLDLLEAPADRGPDGGEERVRPVRVVPQVVLVGAHDEEPAPGGLGLQVLQHPREGQQVGVTAGPDAGGTPGGAGADGMRHGGRVVDGGFGGHTAGTQEGTIRTHLTVDTQLPEVGYIGRGEAPPRRFPVCPAYAQPLSP